MTDKHMTKLCLVKQEKEIVNEETTINKVDESFYKPIWTSEDKKAFAPIDRSQENKDVIIFQETGDIAVFDKIYANRIPTIKVWAKKYYYLADSADDMFGELSFYFSKAVMKFEKKRGSFNTCLYTFFQNCIRNIRNGKKAKKRKPLGADPNSINNLTLSLDYNYNTRDGGESTLKDMLAEEMGEEGGVIDQMNLEETIDILSKKDPHVKVFLKRLGSGNTLSALINELKLKKGYVDISRAQAKIISKRIEDKKGYKREVSNMLKDKTELNKFQLVDCKVTFNRLYYTVELHKTKEADSMMKTIRNIRRDKKHFMSMINGQS